MAGFLSLLRAFLWLRWRTLANLLRKSSRRSASSRLSAWGEVAVRLLLGLMVTGGALLLVVGAAFAVPAVVEAGRGRIGILVAVRVGLLMLLAALVFFAIFQAYRGGTAQAPRLRLLPVSHRRLHLLELLSSAVDPWVLAALPGLAVLVVGVSVLRPAAAVPLLLALLLLAAILATLSATVSFAVQLVLRDRRRAQVVSLVAFLLWILLATLPAMLDDHREDEPPTQPAAEAGPAADGRTVEGSTVERPIVEGPLVDGEGTARRTVRIQVEPPFPGLLQIVPSEAFALTVAAASSPAATSGPGPADAWRGVGALALQLLLLYLVSGALWRRVLAEPAGSGRRGMARDPLPPRVIPGLGPVASAVAWSHVRGTWRSLQGKLAVIAPAVTVAIFTFILRADWLDSLAASGGALVAGAFAAGAVAFTLLSQQAVMLNQFAVDGSGLTLQLLAPLGERDLLRGKAVGGLVLVLVGVVPALLLAVAMAAMTGGAAVLEAWPAVALAALLAAIGGQALLAPVAAWTSLLLPKAVDLNKIGKEGQAHQGAVLLGMVSLGLLLTPALAVGALALWVWKSLLLLVVLEAVVAVACVLLGFVVLGSAEEALARRREALFLAVAERE